MEPLGRDGARWFCSLSVEKRRGRGEVGPIADGRSNNKEAATNALNEALRSGEKTERGGGEVGERKGQRRERERRSGPLTSRL